jgi:MHS family proline/betaine transporter-like MFS transporter
LDKNASFCLDWKRIPGPLAGAERHVSICKISNNRLGACLASFAREQERLDREEEIDVTNAALAPIGLYLRSRVSETPVHGEAVAQKKVAAAPVRDALTVYRRPVLAAFGLSIIGCVGNYVFNIFLPSFATGQLGLPASTAYASGTTAAVVLTVLTPVMGWLSDRIGRKAVLLISSVGYLVLAYPLFHFLVGTPTGIGMVLTQSVAAILLAMYAGPLCAVLSELFPTKVRFTALSIGYSLAVTIFGGFAPFIATFLIRETGSQVSPALYVVAAAAISSITLFLIKDPTNAPLD